MLTATSLVGQGGTFVVHTVLGDDTAPSDRIVIDGGAATGSTRLDFRTAGEGDADNGRRHSDRRCHQWRDDDAGRLRVDAATRTPFVDYDLVRGGLKPSHPENWYLRSTYRPELSLDAAGPMVAQLYGQTLLDTLHERVGDEERLRVGRN